jgi:hypothetical protein
MQAQEEARSKKQEQEAGARSKWAFVTGVILCVLRPKCHSRR